MNQVIIRDMKLEDLENIANILQSDFDDFWNLNIFKQELQNENSKYFVALIDENIVGFAGVWLAVDDMHITNIVTKKNFRKLGIASKLLEKLIEYSKSKKVNTLTLEVSEKNIPAQKLYEKYMFKVLGKRKKYYNDTDALIMTLYFIGGTNEK